MIGFTHNACDDFNESHMGWVHLCPLSLRTVLGWRNERVSKERCLNFLLRRSIGRIEFNGDLQLAEMAIECGTHNAPLKLPILTAKGWNCQGSNPPFAIVLLKILKACHNVGET
jgi:hypothetical protein